MRPMRLFALLSLFAAACPGSERTEEQTPPLAIVSVSPRAGAMDVDPRVAVTVFLDAPLDPTTVTSQSFSLSPSVPAEVRWDAATRSATLAPTEPLKPSTLYTATLSSSVATPSGERLATPYVWTFTTAADTRAPGVVSTVPYPLSSGVPVLSSVTATFSEPMDPSSIDATTFQLAGITATVTYDAASRTATLTPATPLPPGTLLVATLSTGAKDLAGNGLTLPFSWTFRTELDQAGPQVTSTVPESGAVSVPVSAQILASFDEPLDPLTVNATTFTLAGISGVVSYDAASRTATFTPSGPLPPGTSLSASLTPGVKDLAGNALAPRSWSFTTASDVTPPAVSSTEPLEDAVGIGIASAVEVVFSEAMSASTLTPSSFYAEAGGSALPGTVSYDPLTRTATLAPQGAWPCATQIQVRLTTSVRDAHGVALAAPFAWTFTTEADLAPPTVTRVEPSNGQTGVGQASVVRATFSEPLDDSTLSAATFIVGSVAGTVSYDVPTRTAVFTPHEPLPPDAVLAVVLTPGIRDSAGNALSAHTSYFVTGPDVTAPTVTATDPGAEATGVGIDRPIAVTFSEAMTASTLTPASFDVRIDGSPVAGSIAYDPDTRTATFAPAAAWPYERQVHARLTPALKDSHGVALAETVEWTFTTEPDRIPPTVTLVDPANQQTGVTQASLVRATFSEPMDASTLNAASFLVGSLLGTVSYDAASRTATFTPLEPLPPEATVDVTLTDGVKDLAGNVLAGARTWSFTTGPDVTAPTVTARVPMASASDVGVASAISATFSEAMAASTIDVDSFHLLVAETRLEGSVTYDAATRTATLVPAEPLPYTAEVEARLTTAVTDEHGVALASALEWTFTTEADTTPPAVLSTSPEADATFVELRAPLYVQFNEPMNPSSFFSEGVEMTGGSINNLFYDELSRRLWIHHWDFPNGTQVTVSLTSLITDVNGNELVPFSWSFHTVPDTTAPSVVSTTPVDGARLAGRERVEVTFDEAMASGSLTASSFRVSNASGTVSYDGGTRTATFVPDVPLLPGTAYTVELGDTITDIAGNPLSPTTFTFRTAGAPLQLTTTEVAEQYYPVATFNAAGDGLALWTVHSGSASLLVASSYSASTGTWSPEETIERYPNAGAPDRPTAPVASGKVFGVLYRTPTGTSNFRLFEGGSWKAPVPPTCSGNALFASDGTFLLVTNTTSGGFLQSCFFDGTRWAPTVSIESDNSAYSVAVAPDGAFTLLTTSGYLKANTVRLRSWTGSAWSEPTTLFTATEGSVSGPTIAANADGLVAAYTHSSTLVDPTPHALYGLGTREGVWTSAALLGKSADPSLRGQAAATAGRRAVLFNPKGASAALKSSFFDGAGWTTQTVATTSADVSRLAAGANGFLVGWYESSFFWANVYDGSAWGTPLKIDYAPEYAESVAAAGDTYGVLCSPGSTVKVRVWSSGTWAAATQLDGGNSMSRGPFLTSRGGELTAFWQATDHARILRSVLTTSWSTPVEQGQGTYPANASEPRMARAGDTAMAVWHVHGASALGLAETSVYASLFSSGSWGEPVKLADQGSSPGVATNGTDYVVAFDSWGSTARRYDAANSTWSSPVTLQTTYDDVVPSVAANGSTYMLTWALAGDVFVSTSADGLTWSTPENSTTGTSESLSGPRVAPDGAGFIVLYRSRTTLLGRAWAGGVWGAETSLGGLGSSEGFDVASNGSGAMVVGATMYGSVWARSGSGGVWSATSYLGSRTSPPRVASDGSGYIALYGPVRRYSGGSWAPEETVSGTTGGVVAALEKGYVAVALGGDGGYASPVASTFVNGAWGSGGVLESAPGSVSNLVLVGQPGADAMLLWLQEDLTYGVKNLVASSGG